MVLVDTTIWSLALRRRPHDLSAATADRDFPRYARHLPIRLHAPEAAD
jgi:hypothetical protein